MSHPLPTQTARRPQQQDPDVKEIIFWEEGNPNCVVNRLPERMKQKALALPPHLLARHDDEIVGYANTLKSTLIEELRLAFWDEYSVASDANAGMRMGAIYAKLCSREMFYKIIKSEEAFAYILTPPRDYMLKMRSLIEMGHRKMEEILKLNIRQNGKVDVRLGELQLKIMMLADNRVKGAVVQKVQVDQTSKNLHLHAGTKDYEPPKSYQEIQAEILKVQREIRRLQVPESQPEEEILINGFTEEIDVKDKSES